MNLLPLTHEIATRYGWDGNLVGKYGYQSETTKKNFQNWSRRYKEAIGCKRFEVLLLWMKIYI